MITRPDLKKTLREITWIEQKDKHSHKVTGKNKLSYSKSLNK